MLCGIQLRVENETQPSCIVVSTMANGEEIKGHAHDTILIIGQHCLWHKDKHFIYRHTPPRPCCIPSIASLSFRLAHFSRHPAFHRMSSFDVLPPLVYRFHFNCFTILNSQREQRRQTHQQLTRLYSVPYPQHRPPSPFPPSSSISRPSCLSSHTHLHPNVACLQEYPSSQSQPDAAKGGHADV